MPTGQAATSTEAPSQRPLTAQQLRFVEELCCDWNKAGAARRAGYSNASAKQMGQKLWRDPRVKAAVAKRTEELAMTAGEATVRMSSWGRASIEDVFTIGVEEYRPRIERPVAQVIPDLRAELEFEQELAIRAEALLTDRKVMKKFRQGVGRAHQQRQLELMRYEMLLERNPNATAWVLGAPVARKVAQLDIVKALEMQAGGLIKKITPTRFGIGVELYDAMEATDKILKLVGAYAPQKFDHATNGENMGGINIYVPDNGR